MKVTLAVKVLPYLKIEILAGGDRRQAARSAAAADREADRGRGKEG